MYKEYKGNTENGRGRVGESTAPRRSSPLEGQKTTAIEHSGPTLNTSARHFALERALRDGAALHLAARVAEGREDALLLFRGRDDSVGKVLSEGVVRRRKTSMTDYRLEQVADCLCTIELALVKYEAKEDGETYNKFFGGIGSFKRNWLKQARSKRI
ncbi:MAG: hypothetical protein ACLVJ0_06760 [Collinsella aerofaciens]|uniref:hypothetical protein n=1 Tax=Collinsella aerofaciens TaxID=74426 RepID=UPI003219EF50